MREVRPQSGIEQRETTMKTQSWIRQTHRWLSMIFTATVITNFVALALTNGAPPAWITYSPLLPLLILMLTGVYLFALPYVVKRRG
jgi:heme A synthase